MTKVISNEVLERLENTFLYEPLADYKKQPVI